ncbi:MAG: protein kinase [Candidatus Algichlamydia australiensis]|nr:protein kinase [Chlamydiales bacterium]
MEKIGRYQIIRRIARGGMGEVYLAYDPLFSRQIALKRIRSDLKRHKILCRRFLREAKIAASLTHPSIVPVYEIHDEGEDLYYTMPFIEGESLKDILVKARNAEKQGKLGPEVGKSTPALMRLLLPVCQAIHFIHSKGFLHRDIKPGNIIIGKFGEVRIIDWGVALAIGQQDESLDLSGEPGLTSPGKVVGTVTYMAPERILGDPSTIQTDIYALGVTLYLMLTLKLPFKRSSLEHARKNLDKERWIDLFQAAPFREIPPNLSKLTKACLSPNREERPKSVMEIIAAIENYLEGKPEWQKIAELNLENPEDWKFQETIHLTKQQAVTPSLDLTQWVVLMISKQPLCGNYRIATELQLGYSSQGFGFLFSVPQSEERSSLHKGLMVWIGSEKNPGCSLCCSDTQVAYVPDVALKADKTHEIEIIKEEHLFNLYIDGKLVLSYESWWPFVGSHIGLLYGETDFEIGTIEASLGSSTRKVNCLSIPDAFMANKEYDKASKEYLKIVSSFKGRREGREALFRAGICSIKEKKFDEANALFEQFSNTEGAPLEYLGKSITYQKEGDFEEEIKCLEFGLRRFPRHPSRSYLYDQIHFRLLESSKQSLQVTFGFLLLALRMYPEILPRPETKLLFESAKKSLTPLPFMERITSSQRAEELCYAIELAFWLGKVTILKELLVTDVTKLEEQEVLSKNIDNALNYLAQPKPEKQILLLFPEKTPALYRQLAILCRSQGRRMKAAKFEKLISSLLSSHR